MLKTSSLESLLSPEPNRNACHDAGEVWIKEAADRTRSKITGAFHGAVKIKAKVKAVY